MRGVLLSPHAGSPAVSPLNEGETCAVPALPSTMSLVSRAYFAAIACTYSLTAL